MAKRILITSDLLGSGDEELGRVLMRNFLYSLARDTNAPASVSFLNSGVRLACAGSDSLDDLRLLVEKGVAVKACGTCLDYYRLSDELTVGEVGTMPQTVAAITGDDAVVVLA